MVPYRVQDQWMWVRSTNDVGLYPCDRLSAAPEGVFLRYPENNKCSFCNLVVSIYTFESHVRKYPSGDCQFSYKCSNCTKIFKHLFSLQSHTCDAIDINLKQCPYCKNNFYSRHILKRHMSKNICLSACSNCKNICKVCLVKNEFSYDVFSKMYNVPDFEDFSELRDLFYNQKETLFNIINDLKNFSALMKSLRLRSGKNRWLLIEILLELIDKVIHNLYFLILFKN